MNISRYLKRLVSGDNAAGGASASLRSIIAWLFIALVALFLTHPSADAPLPWPAELGLDGGPGPRT